MQPEEGERGSKEGISISKKSGLTDFNGFLGLMPKSVGQSSGD